MRDKQALFGSMARMGDVTQIRIGPSERVVVLTHPDDVKTVLVTNQRNFTKGRGLESTQHTLGTGLLTSEGEFHLRQRRLIQPAFHRDRIAGFASLMTAYAEREQERWGNGETRDVHVDMMRLTLTIAGKAFFDADVEREAEVVAEALELALRMFNYRIVFGTLPQYVPLPWIRRMHEKRRQMDAFIYGLIEARRAGGGDHGDILSMLVAARDGEAGDADHGGMTDRQLRDEVITLLMAGHETTAVALSWTWYLLSQYPEVEARLHAELAEVLGGRTPTAEDLTRLTYTRAVFAESMRLYPPAWILERRAVDDFEVGGYRIGAGAIVLMSQYIIHRDPRWWPEPERFMPERWLNDAEAETKERPRFAYFPFGAGTRICVGEHFAWMEGVLVLATIAQRWQLRHDPTHRVEREALVTLRPKYGMQMRLTRR